MKQITLIYFIALFCAISAFSLQGAKAEELTKNKIQQEQAAPHSNNHDSNDAQDLVEERLPEDREILDQKEQIARGHADHRIQSFENEKNKGVQATATTRIDMR